MGFTTHDDAVLSGSFPEGADPLCRILGHLVVDSRSLSWHRLHFNFAASEGRSSPSHRCAAGRPVPQRRQGAQKVLVKAVQAGASNVTPQLSLFFPGWMHTQQKISRTVELSGIAKRQKAFDLDWNWGLENRLLSSQQSGNCYQPGRPGKSIGKRATVPTRRWFFFARCCIGYARGVDAGHRPWLLPLLLLHIQTHYC